MIETLGSLLNQGLAVVVPMTILLGLLIFVHELGHFLAAKYFGVKVETFSLGFGPKIIKFEKGGTTYCLSALPLGGYVKMFGDEPGKDIPFKEQQGSFLHKPVGARIVIALAGPLMNLFFAAFLFYMVANVGDKAVSPIVGEIPVNSKAWETGFRPYDKILKVGSVEIKTWDAFNKIIEQSSQKSISITVDRDGSKETLTATPSSTKNKNVLSSDPMVGAIAGLTNQTHLPFVGMSANSPLLALGLKSGDHITHVGETEVKFFKDISQELARLKASGQDQAIFKAKRYENFLGSKPKFENIVSQPFSLTGDIETGLFIPETVVAQVRENSPAERAGIQVLDQILEINGKAIISFTDIVSSVSGFTKDDQPLDIVVVRGLENIKLQMSPEITELEDRFGIKEERYTIGIVPLKNSMAQSFRWVAGSFSESMEHALGQTWEWTQITCLSFWRMLQGRVPAKNIGGFISIGQVASHSWALGLGAFLKIMAIISINLFILNLLPIPILDGGHLLLFFLEALKGSPLSLRKIQFAQQVGFLFILFLMAFALFNDFSRLFGS